MFRKVRDCQGRIHSYGLLHQEAQAVRFCRVHCGFAAVPAPHMLSIFGHALIWCIRRTVTKYRTDWVCPQDYNDARDAKDDMDRRDFMGRQVDVVFAQQRRKTPDQMRVGASRVDS